MLINTINSKLCDIHILKEKVLYMKATVKCVSVKSVRPLKFYIIFYSTCILFFSILYL